MPDIDPEAAGILIANGVDPLTSVAGSIIEEPQNPRPGKPYSKALLAVAIICGLVVGILLASL